MIRVGTRIVPPSAAPLEDRIQEAVPYHLWRCPAFPIALLGGRLDKDPQQTPWLQGLYEDLERAGRFRNPVFVWNHHANRLTGKQPEWLLRAGSNRVWCAEQLGWTSVPALVSTATCSEIPPSASWALTPRELEEYLNDPGVCWANDYGFGLLGVHRPEDMYAEFTESSLQATHHHRKTRFPNVKDVVSGPDS